MTKEEKINKIRERVDRYKKEDNKRKKRKLVKKTKEQIRLEKEFDNLLLRYEKKFTKLPNKYKSKKDYAKELNSKEWEAKRESIKKLDNYKCRHCGSDKNLCVHHLTYIKGRKAWKYPNELLITLCSSCHTKAHYLT